MYMLQLVQHLLFVIIATFPMRPSWLFINQSPAASDPPHAPLLERHTCSHNHSNKWPVTAHRVMLVGIHQTIYVALIHDTQKWVSWYFISPQLNNHTYPSKTIISQFYEQLFLYSFTLNHEYSPEAYWKWLQTLFSYTWIKFELPKIIFIIFLVCIVYSCKRKLIQWKWLYSLFKKYKM